MSVPLGTRAGHVWSVCKCTNVLFGVSQTCTLFLSVSGENAVDDIHSGGSISLCDKKNHFPHDTQTIQATQNVHF